MTTGKEEPIPPAKIPSKGKLLEISGEAHDYLMQCIQDSNSAESLAEQIRLAMLVKVLKMYHNLMQAAAVGDPETPPIIGRIIYEFTLSAAYMVVNDEDDPDIYEKFKQSALTRSHQIIKDIEKSDLKDRESSRQAIDSIKAMLLIEGYDISQKSHLMPKSWHPTKSYMAMASELGGEFNEFYEIFYGVTSIYIHPNWLDLKRYLRFNPDGSASAKLLNEMQPNHLQVSATCLALKLAEIYRINFVRLGIDLDAQRRILQKINETHYRLHN